MNSHIERLPPHFLTAVLDKVDWNQIRLPAVGLSATGSAVCYLAPERAKQVLQQAEAIVDATLDFFDSKTESSALLIFYCAALYHLYSSYCGLEELTSATGGDHIAKTLNIDFCRIRTDVESLLRWWSTLSRRERILIQNVDEFMERIDLLAKDIRQAQIMLEEKQRELARKQNESAFLEVAGIVGFLGFGGVLLCSPHVGGTSLLGGKAVGTALAGGTVVMSKWYQGRIERCSNNLQMVKNDLVKLATKLSVRHSTLVAILTAPAA